MEGIGDGVKRWSTWRIIGWTAAALVLLAPRVAMRFTDEVQWDGADFAFAGALLFGIGAALEAAARRTADRSYRAAVGVALAATLLLVWANAAVGIVGHPGNDANLLFDAVLAVGIAGAVLARFRAAGMAWALAATALAHAAAAAIALAAGWGEAAVRPEAIVLPNALFVGLWLASAWLFDRAARGGG